MAFFIISMVLIIPGLIYYGWVRDIRPSDLHGECARALYRPHFEEKDLLITKRPAHIRKANPGRVSEATELLTELKNDKMLQAQIEDQVDKRLHPRRKVFGWIGLIGTMLLLGTLLGVIHGVLSASQIQTALGGLLALFSDYFVGIAMSLSLFAGGVAIKQADKRHFKLSESDV